MMKEENEWSQLVKGREGKGRRFDILETLGKQSGTDEATTKFNPNMGIKHKRSGNPRIKKKNKERKKRRG